MTDGRADSAAADVYKGTEVIGFSIGDACGTRYSLSIFFVRRHPKSNSLSHIQKQGKQKKRIN